MDKIEDCFDYAVDTLDGVYGWVSEAIAVVVLVFFFNFLMKRFLKILHLRFQRQNKFWRDAFVRALYSPLSSFIWFFAIVQALTLIFQSAVQEISIETRHDIISTGALVAFGWFLMRWKRFIVEKMMLRSRSKEIVVDQGKIGAIDKILTVTIFFFMILILMEITDRSVNTIIAFGGVGGLALAFASQEVISNFFGGFMIYLTQPFTINDWILIPDHKIEGIVEEIGWYMTRVRSLDKRPIYIPNAIFSRLIVITPSRMSHRQIQETIGIRCSDLPKIRTLVKQIKEMLEKHPDLDTTQPIIARLASFGSFSLDVMVQVFTLTTNKEGYLKIKEDVLLKIADVIMANDAEIAIPTQLVTMVSSPGTGETP